ncbi:MAG: hypothetical protein KAZ18_02940 [Acinetobacter sp.]|nr:hypothetical protein [Acinetobacter sp.]
MFDQIKKWWCGVEVLADKKVGDPIRPNPPSRFRRHWTSIMARLVVSLFSDPERCRIMLAILAVIAIVISVIDLVA